MTDFVAERRMMVDGQVRTSDVTDQRIIAAMLALPREQFVPPESRALAYLDIDLPTSGGRAMLKPMVLSKLIQAAEIGAGDHVLVVGSLMGYGAAVIAHLARSVVALDDAHFTAQARASCQALGLASVKAVSGALPEGCAAEGPYDVIVLEGASEIEPRMLFAQLKDGGRMVGVVGRGRSAKAMLYRSARGEVSGRAIFDAAAPLLPGFVAPAAFVF